MKLLAASLLLLFPVTLHAQPKDVAPIPSLFTKPPAPGPLSRFARLCGMFMGRVDVVRVGTMRMKINLALK